MVPGPHAGTLQPAQNKASDFLPLKYSTATGENREGGKDKEMAWIVSLAASKLQPSSGFPYRTSHGCPSLDGTCQDPGTLLVGI